MTFIANNHWTKQEEELLKKLVDESPNGWLKVPIKRIRNQLGMRMGRAMAIQVDRDIKRILGVK